jgi:hypothetical protein
MATPSDVRVFSRRGHRRRQIVGLEGLASWYSSPMRGWRVDGRADQKKPSS